MLKIAPPKYVYCPFCGIRLNKGRGEGKVISLCKKCKWIYRPRVATSANAIILKNGKVLLVRRAIEPEKGKWVFPGGFTSYGEHPTDTVKREVWEETGLRLKRLKLIDVVHGNDDIRSPGRLTFFYRAEPASRKSRKKDSENSAIQWFDIHKLPPIGFEIHRQIAKQLRF